MRQLIDGARQLPLRHLSIRVPWNDSNWSGVVCARPGENNSCLVLPRISETRNDQFESQRAAKSWDQLSQDELPVCVGEHGGFMAPFEIVRQIKHPYSEGSSLSHKHFLPTPLRYPPYSAACIPFRWMLKSSAELIIKTLNLGYQPDLETQARSAIGFDTSWIQDKFNQLVLMDSFFGAVRPEQSLCFFYAKRTPFFDDNRRVIIGVGLVNAVGDYTEYLYDGPGPLQSILWERSVQHSIRQNFKNGFIFPYHALQDYLIAHPEESPEPFVAVASDEYIEAFSYGTEHVTNDAAIGVLLACSKALHNLQKVVPGDWEPKIAWIDARLNELWKMRGPCPGLGAALSAFGCENGTLVALEMERIAAENSPNQIVDPWVYVEQWFGDSNGLQTDPNLRAGDMIRKKWKLLPGERKNLLKLLSRFALSASQATRYYVHEEASREKAHISVNDEDILKNPYLLYELDRTSPDPISLSIIDRGVFPENMIRDQFPLPEPSRVIENVDERRIRAFVVRQLEEAAARGDSLYPRDRIIQEIRALDVQPPCPADGDLIAIAESTFEPTVHLVQMADGQRAYQLERLSEIRNLIRSSIQKRISGKRHSSEISWREFLDAALPKLDDPDDEQEIRAREEKTEALRELFESRLSVLIGPAGTGKTTLLEVLCNQPTVKANGILMLAPTGKARVRMEEQTRIRGAQTIAQFLLPIDRYDPETGAYRLSKQEKVEAGKTVIIDEASMLTEEQLAAVLDALKGVERLILVGDPRQLPPIGAGRPFLDVVNFLAPNNVETIFPRVARGYAELTVRRRQIGNARKDLLLAEWFSGRPMDTGADIIWEDVQKKESDGTVRLVQWDQPNELQTKLLEVLVEELGLDSKDDWAKFEQSLGGVLFNGSVYFNGKYNDRPGSSSKIEDWQILSPVRSSVYGVDAINHLIQTTFRQRTKTFATQKYRKIPKPMGREGILYGDKVMQVINQRRFGVYPKINAQQYVANGEIGIVVGQFKGPKAAYKGLPWELEVEFSTQPGFSYKYGDRDFGDEAEAPIELAYSLTIHKTQGSEFKKTFIVLPNPCRLLSRELLYTALTRQKERLIILHQGDFHNLIRFSGDYYSEAARRLTNIFTDPNPVQLNDRFLEDRLINKTRKGESVRSKSEVIIANLLYEKKIDYTYEQRLFGKDGSSKIPDFTIEDSESGVTYYWEHLGMLNDPAYRERWQRKLLWYQSQGILPHEQGGGPNGYLITSEDSERGGIDSAKIEQIIDQVLL